MSSVFIFPSLFFQDFLFLFGFQMYEYHLLTCSLFIA
jgi:hypothetical protein